MLTFRLAAAVVVVVVSMSASFAEAQLFRFRANKASNARQNVTQQQGYPSRYDAQSYQYTQVQPQANFVPSQRVVAQQQPQCLRPQPVYVASGASVGSLQPQPQLQPQQAQLQPVYQRPVVGGQRSEMVAVTYRDPYSGRLFQRTYLVQQPASTTTTAQLAVPQTDAVRSEAVVTSALSQVAPIGTQAADSSLSTASGVQTTSFESPILENNNGDAGEQLSILNANESDAGDSGDVAKSVLEAPLPTLELEAPDAAMETPGSLLDTGDELNLDLPPLEASESQ